MSPGGSGTLANLAVQFALQGQQTLQAAFDKIHQQVTAIAQAAEAMGEKMQKATNAINIAVGAGVGIVANFVRQGLAASTMGQLFQVQMERLSLTIAGLFRPELEKVLGAVQKLTDWIQHLTDAQKASIARWIEGAAAAVGLAVILPRIVSGVRAVITAVIALGEAIAAAEVATGIGAILPLLGLVVEAMGLLLVGTQAGRQALSGLWDVIKQIGSALAKLWDASGASAFLELVGQGLAVIAQALGRAAAKVGDVISGMMKAGKLGDFFATMGKIVVVLAEGIAAVVDRVSDFIAAMLGLPGVQSAWDAFREQVLNLHKLLLGLVMLAGKLIAAFLDSAPVQAFLTVAIAGFRVLLSVVQKIAEAVNFILRPLNSLLGVNDALDKVKTPTTAGKKDEGNRNMLAPRGGGFEGLDQTYRRIAAASIGVGGAGKSAEERMVDEQHQSNQYLRRINENTANPRAPIGR